MKFNSLGGLFAHYFEVREALRSPRTNMPQPEALRQEIFVSNPRKARSSLECKKAFIGDVEIYISRLEWYESAILQGRIVPPGEDQKGWNTIIKGLNRDPRPLPKRLKDKGNMSKEFHKIIKPNAEAYFRDRGYIR